MTAALFLAGGALLIGGAELLVRGASRLASAVGIAPLVVGLTVVAFGTSAPELAVTVGSAWAGEADVALGNVVVATSSTSSSSSGCPRWSRRSWWPGSSSGSTSPS